MKIIVGLGNPGKEYETTRHNVGFMAIDHLAEHLGATWENNKKLRAQIARSGEYLLIKPLTYMNLSGESVTAVMSFYKMLPLKFGFVPKKESDLSETLIVIHDDIDIDLGKMKTTKDSGSAGHRGVESLIKHLKTKKFQRLRIGVKTEKLAQVPTEKFVLERFNKDELLTIDHVLKTVVAEIK